MQIEELVVTLKAQTDGFKNSMRDATKSIDNAARDIGKVGTSLTRNVTVPILALGGAVLGMANKYAQMGDDIAKTSKKLGIPTDALQEMDFWATQNGISSEAMERGVGRLNQRIGRAADGNQKYADAFALLGVEIEDANGNIRGTDEVMKDTVASLRDIEDPALRSARASEIFGTRMARDLMPALEDGSLSLEEAAKRAEELGIIMDKDAVAAAEKYTDSMDELKREFSAVWMELANQFIPVITEQLIPAIQDKVLPAIREFVDRLKGLWEWFQNLSPETKKYIGMAVALLVALGPILVVVSKLIIGIKGLGAIIAVIASPVGIIIGLVVALAAGLIYLWNTNEEFREKVIKAWEKIKEVGLIVWEGLKEGALAFWEVLKDSWEGIVDLWENDLKPAFMELWDEVTKIFEEVQEAISEAFGDGEKDAMSFAEIMKVAGKIIGKVVVGIVKGFAWIVGRIVNLITWYLRLQKRLREIGEKIGQSIKDWVQDGVDGFNNMVAWFQDLPGRMFEFGVNMIKGFIQGIMNMAGRLSVALRGVVSDAVDSAKNLLGISSPSKVFEDMGKDVGLGFEKGMDKMQSTVGFSMEHLVSPGDDLGGGQGPVNITNNFSQTEMDVDALSRKLNFQMQTI